jgi:hypothetical protein
MKNRLKVLLVLLSLASGLKAGIRLSEPMENAVKICRNISSAFKSNNSELLKETNKLFKSAKINDFKNLRLVKGKNLSVDGHLIFDEEFIDSLIVNRKVTEFSLKFAHKRANRGTTGVNGGVRLTSRAVKKGESVIWKTTNCNIAEYALVAEPDGLFTMTIRDSKGKVLYCETTDNKKGASVRKARIRLPKTKTEIQIEIKNTGKEDKSFALISN